MVKVFFLRCSFTYLKIVLNLGVKVDIAWSEEVVEGPFAPKRTVVHYMSQKLTGQAMANYPPVNLSTIEEEDLDESDKQQQTIGNPTTPISKWLPYYLIPLKPQSSFTQVRVTHVDQLGQLYYHLYEERFQIRQMRNFYATLYSLHKRETSEDQLYNQLRNDWKENEACVARYDNDSSWYRGTVMEKYSNDEYLVYFIDFGNHVPVNFEFMRTPLEYRDGDGNFSNIPGLARRIILNAVQPPRDTNEWSKAELDGVFRNTFYQEIDHLVTIKYAEEPSKDIPIKADIRLTYYPDSRNDKKVVDLAKRMINVGHAKKGDIKITPELKKNFNLCAHGAYGEFNLLEDSE